MKTFSKTLLFAFLLLSTQVFSQSDGYQTAMEKGLDLLSANKSSENFIIAANHFERIAKAESKQWLPIYYSAYANLVVGLLSKDNDLKDQYFDRALAQVEQADVISTENSEIYTLKGYIQFMKMSVQPVSRMALAGNAKDALEKAKLLNPENPRPYFVLAQHTFYTPNFFGGGKDKAKPMLQIAAIKFHQFKPAMDLSPNWGEERTKMLLSQCE